MLGNRVEIDRQFRDQYCVSAGGSAGLQGQPAGLFALHLDYSDLSRRPCRLARTVQHLDGETERTVEAERNHGGGDIVLERARNTHRVQALAMQLVEDTQPAAANDRNQRTDALRLQCRQQFVGTIDLFDHAVFVKLTHMEGIDPRRLTQHARGGRIQTLRQLRRQV